MHLFVLLSAIVASATAIFCPSGYTPGFDNACYKLYTTPMTKVKADFACQKDGAMLPKIQSDDKNNYIRNFARQVGAVFLGATCVNDQLNTCRWEDLGSLTYENFYADKPATKYGNCLWMDETVAIYQGAWASVDCTNTTTSFVCQWQPTYGCDGSDYTTSMPVSTAIPGQIDGLCNSGQILFTPVTIFTPNYPGNYPMNYGCVWHIHSPWGASVNITITDLQIDGGTRIGIYAENDFNIPILVINATQPTPIYLHDIDYNPTIVFETADYTPFRGFKAVITDAYSFNASVILKKERRQL